MPRISIFILFLLLVSGCTDNTPVVTEPDDPLYILYVPEGIDPNGKYPLVIALSPSADAQTMVKTWQKSADKHKWIVAASTQYRNGKSFAVLMPQVKRILEEVSKKNPVDMDHVILTGFSGGAMGSHAYTVHYPDDVWATVLNTGMINSVYYRLRTMPENRTAVFLASPTDFRYDEMKRDKALLDGRGWDTNWIEFAGGHKIAPDETYMQAADWLAERM